MPTSLFFFQYNVLAAGETGGNGEYAPQEGFGWTNGVIFELLNRWSNLTPNDLIFNSMLIIPNYIIIATKL